jgi:hypothetical protein
MKIHVLPWMVFLTLFANSCGKPKGSPEEAFDSFLDAVHKKDCKRVFAFFSIASQEKIRAEAARAAKESPAYAQEFTPETFYCTSVYANRWFEYNRGSSKPGKIEGTNATTFPTTRKGVGFALPGFSPFRWKNIPTEVRMVRENGGWKIDLLTPTTELALAIGAREKAMAREREMMAAARQQTQEQLYHRCTNFHLVAHWSFKAVPAGGKIADETGTFMAELLGAQIVDLPEGRALQFRAEGEALRLPEAVLSYRPCGAITFGFRRDDAQTLNRVLLKVWPGSFCETGIEVHPDGRIHYNVQRNALTGTVSLEPMQFYQLAFVWNERGMRIYVDGNLEASQEKPVHVGAYSRLTELGRDPNNPAKTGSHMTIRDLKIYEGIPGEGDLINLTRPAR